MDKKFKDQEKTPGEEPVTVDGIYMKLLENAQAPVEGDVASQQSYNNLIDSVLNFLIPVSAKEQALELDKPKVDQLTNDQMLELEKQKMAQTEFGALKEQLEKELKKGHYKQVEPETTTD